MDKALIVIDYTNDFVADNGKLTAGKPAQAIEGKIVELMQRFGKEEQFIVIANDIHYEDEKFHPEASLFPPHNIDGTNGRNLYGKVYDEYFAQCLDDNTYSLSKTRYSAFAGTNLEILLRERGINELHLVGVCTDICVLHTAIDAYNKGFKVVIHEDAVASFNQAGHEWAIGHFKGALGFEVVNG